MLVILEQHFTNKNGHHYTDVQCDSSFWERYLSVFDKLIVCARTHDATAQDDVSHMLCSDHDDVSFVGMPDFVGATGPIKNYPAIKKAILSCTAHADAVIFRMPSPISMVAYPIVRKTGLPWAAEMMMNPRTAYSADSMHHPLQSIIQQFITRQTKHACMEANGVAYVTEHVLQEEYPCRAMTADADDLHFTGSYSTINLKASDYSMSYWGDQAPETITLAHTGKMSDDRKGHAIFLHVIALLRIEGVDAHGILIGDGPKRADFETLASELGIRDACDFAGWKSGFSEVQTELQRAQFFVMPTKSEGLPRAIIEAMASGLICLANNVDGNPELLDAECLSADNSAESYAVMVNSLLGDWPHALAMRMRQHDRSRAYECDKLMTKRHAFYTKLRCVSEAV